MTRHELMCRMSGQELQAWVALAVVRSYESDRDAKYRSLQMAHPGEQVVVSGQDPLAPGYDDEDESDELDDDENQDGPTE